LLNKNKSKQQPEHTHTHTHSVSIMKTSDIIHREKEAEKCMVCAVYWTTGYAKKGVALALNTRRCAKIVCG